MMPTFRLDRTLALLWFRTRQRTGLRTGEFRLPILMYHSVSGDREADMPAYYRTSTSPATFEHHIRFLHDEGFRSVNLNEGRRILQEERAPQDKPVVITFDDGFRDFFDLALPILKRYGFTATVFLPTAFIGESRRSFKGRECLTWTEVRALRAQGFQFGSHTANHPVLYKLSWNQIGNELAISKEQIEQRLGEKITSFSYPYAFPQHDPRFTEGLVRLLRDQGYETSVTTMIGCAYPEDEPFCLKRLPINNCDDEELFAAKLSGAYDWLAGPQSWFKAVRHRLTRSSRRRSDLELAAQTT